MTSLLHVKHGFVSTQPDSLDPNLVSSTPWNADHVIVGPILQVSPYFNIGIDGPLNFDGVSTVLGMVPATLGGYKIYTLTRCIYGSTIVIAAGVKIFAANWRVFASVSIIGAGSGLSFIHNDGNDAPNAVIGGAIVAATATPAGYYAATLAGLSNNGAGLPLPFASTSAAATGGLGDATHANNGNTPAARFMGGSGGGVSTGTTGTSGAVGGSYTVSNSNVGFSIAEQIAFKSSVATAGGSGTAIAFGTAINQNPTGGGAGASAGALYVAAPVIQGVTISCNGGRGGNGANGSWVSGSDHGDCASGGGGGGGGMPIVIYATSADLAVFALGGVGGNGVAFNTLTHSQTCVAGNGASGSPGRTFVYNISGDGT